MHILTKKEKELIAFTGVLNYINLESTLVNRVIDEHPDFVFSSNGKRIGAEVTELYLTHEINNIPHQQLEGEERLTIQLALKKAIEFNIPPQFVTIRLSRHHLAKKAREDNAADICGFVSRHFAQPGEVKGDFDRHILPACISHVTMYGSRIEHTWNGSTAGFVHEYHHHGVQAAIHKKEKERMRYLQQCSEIWLIIQTPREGQSALIDISHRLKNHAFDCKFDRAFFYHGLSGQVFEMKLSKFDAVKSML